jgi:hypothetical protein
VILTRDLWVTDERGVTWSVGLVQEAHTHEHRWFDNTCPKCHGCVVNLCDVHPACICRKAVAS